MLLVRYLIPVLCLLLGSGVCRAQVSGNNSGFCLSGVKTMISNLACAEVVHDTSAYEALRSRLWGELVRQVWRNSRKRHEKSSSYDAKESKGVQGEDTWKRMLREADYDLSISTHRFVMSVRMQF